MIHTVRGSSCFVVILLMTSTTVFAQLGSGLPGGFEGYEQSIPRVDTAYGKVVHDTAAMIADPRVQFHAAKYGLDVINLTWEDTARFEDSSVGPNISDVTIQVQQQNPKTKQYVLTCMPVIRFPNFTDKTADLPLDKFKLIVGNQAKGQKRKTVTLLKLLEDPRLYMSNPASWKGKTQKSLLKRGETHALVSAQACFLPIPNEKIAEFNPVIFNYQSCEQDPAVLTILATREGTSMTIIDNVRDGFEAGSSWGQRLFFNHEGKRAVLTGQRKSDFHADNRNETSTRGVQAADEKGLNLVLLIQVPLKQKYPQGGFLGGLGGFGREEVEISIESRSDDVEEAVIGHGRVEGPFTEIDDLKIQRDPRYPIRVTVQFYQATSNGVVSEQDMDILANQIQRVYKDADFVGSLVVGDPSGRPTEYDGPKVEPPHWWKDFWKRHENNTGQNRAEALQVLRRTLGPHWVPKSQNELQRALARQNKASTTP